MSVWVYVHMYEIHAIYVCVGMYICTKYISYNRCVSDMCIYVQNIYHICACGLVYLCIKYIPHNICKYPNKYY